MKGFSKVELRFIQEFDKALTDIINGYKLPKKAAIAFSGGVDSSTIAYKLMKLGYKTELITTGSCLSKDKNYAETFANKFVLPLHYIDISKELIHKKIPIVFKLLKESTPTKIKAMAEESRFKYAGLRTYPNAMDIAIGICMYEIAQKMKSLNLGYILSGHGAGDIFAGGFLAIQKKPEELEEYLQSKAVPMGFVDIVRDSLIFKHFDIVFKSPLLEDTFVRLVDQVPLDLKLKRRKEKVIRKYIWIKYSLWLGVPSVIANRIPKSMQYSCGIYKWVMKDLLNSYPHLAQEQSV